MLGLRDHSTSGCRTSLKLRCEKERKIGEYESGILDQSHLAVWGPRSSLILQQLSMDGFAIDEKNRDKMGVGLQ